MGFFSSEKHPKKIIRIAITFSYYMLKGSKSKALSFL